jgi:DNA invertase Pin-like site-specific DNA recombinase
MKLGYARVSTEDQSLEIQCRRLSAAGCEMLFEEKISGAARSRPALEKLTGQIRKGGMREDVPKRTLSKLRRELSGLCNRP